LRGSYYVITEKPSHLRIIHFEVCEFVDPDNWSCMFYSFEIYGSWLV